MDVTFRKTAPIDRIRELSAFRESWNASERPGGSHAVHGGPRHFSHRDMMQDVECPVINGRSFLRSRCEPEDRVPVGGQLRRPPSWGGSAVGQFDQSGELLVI